MDATKTPKAAPNAPAQGKDPKLIAPWQTGTTLISGGSCGDVGKSTAHVDHGGRWTDDRHAIDFGVCGDDDYALPVLAAHTGFVRIARSDPDYGWTVVLEREDGLATRYAHLKENPRLRLGSRVTQGDVIGRIGYSGLGGISAKHAHLHFAAYRSRRLHAALPVRSINGKEPCEGCEILSGPDSAVEPRPQDGGNANRPPTADLPDYVDMHVNGESQFCAEVADPDGDTLTTTFAAQRGMVGPAFAGSRPGLMCTKYKAPSTPGYDTVSVAVSDGKATGTDWDTIMIAPDDFGP